MKQLFVDIETDLLHAEKRGVPFFDASQTAIVVESRKESVQSCLLFWHLDGLIPSKDLSWVACTLEDVTMV